MTFVDTARYVGPWTYDDVHELPDDDLLHEAIDGVLLVSASPGTTHQLCLSNLVAYVMASVPAGLEAIVGPVDWYVNRLTFFAPDLVVVRRQRPPDPALVVPPLLIVEVLSPGTKYRDLGLKKRAYEDAGVPWYWVVDPVEERLTAYQSVDGRFVERVAAEGDELAELDEPFPVKLSPRSLLD
jgi:Uma2 family endonuclease